MEIEILMEMLWFKVFLASYVSILSFYVIFECMSAAGDTVRGGKLCISARYLFSAIAGIYLFKSSFTYLYYVTVCHAVGVPSYCVLIKGIPNLDALYITAIFLGCWPRMVYRLFGHKLDSLLLSELKNNKVNR